GETRHKSSLLLTSREKPKEVALLEGKKTLVRSLSLVGLNSSEGYSLLESEELSGSNEEWRNLVDLYSGNPLYLKIVSEAIRTLFKGNIASFLKQGMTVFGDIRDPLDIQFSRLSDLEREVIYWLAIEHQEVTLSDLRGDVSFSISDRTLLGVLNSLYRRSLIETKGVDLFTLQPVIREYIIEKFVNSIWMELEEEEINLFGQHALIKAVSKDNVRRIQIDRILRPLAKRLVENFGKDGGERKLKNILSKLRNTRNLKTGYAVGNILNLLVELQINLHGYDFSYQIVRQAYLRGVSLTEVNFEHANLRTSVFTESFGSVLSVAFSPDQKLLAAGTANGEIRLWEVSNDAPYFSSKEHTDWVRSIAFSPDGKTIASG
ncbi:MAG TPA: pentapeptide repeat-containing protein, partial [Methylomirabilota bacterium]|nr:pentapeptide repeat-containing protein [Methylomirabilota bacterium]